MRHAILAIAAVVIVFGSGYFAGRHVERHQRHELWIVKEYASTISADFGRTAFLRDPCWFGDWVHGDSGALYFCDSDGTWFETMIGDDGRM